MVVSATGAVIDYGCDSGTIEEPLTLDDQEQFTAGGTHSFGRGGPSHQDDPLLRRHPARYEGKTSGATMQLRVLLPALARVVGEFRLERGSQASLDRCL